MPLSEATAQASVMIVAPNAMGDHHPIGTGFLVSLPGPAPNTAFEYLVTAAHVVRFREGTFLRVSLVDGQPPLDMPVPKWIFHDDEETDVAVSAIWLDQAVHSFKMIPITSFADEEPPIEARLGDDVFFIGLLGNIKSMHGQNVPMVRSGALGRFYQEEVKVEWPDESIHSITAHLIDCRSHSGFSGSPCYVQFSPRGRAQVRDGDTFLLGLITGHLDEMAPRGTARNTGVGLVTPVEDIRHVLMQPEFANERQMNTEAYIREHPVHEAEG